MRRFVPALIGSFSLAVALLPLSACSPTRSTDAASIASAESTEQDAWTVDVGFLEFPNSGAAEAQDPFLRGVAFLHSFAYKQAIQQFQEGSGDRPRFCTRILGRDLLLQPSSASRAQTSTRRERSWRRLGRQQRRSAPRKRRPSVRKTFWQPARRCSARATTARASHRLQGSHGGNVRDLSRATTRLQPSTPCRCSSAIGPMKDDQLPTRHGGRGHRTESVRPQPRPSRGRALHHPRVRRPDPRAAGPAGCRSICRDRCRRLPRAPHADPYLHSARYVGEGQRAERLGLPGGGRSLYEKGDMVSDMVHAIDWGHYGDLQWGNRAKAKNRREILDQVIEMSDGATRAVQTEGLMWAREVVETEEWATREITDQTSGSGCAGDRAERRGSERPVANRSRTRREGSRTPARARQRPGQRPVHLPARHRTGTGFAPSR